MTTSISNADIVKKIKEALNERFDIDVSKVDENSRMRELGVDSLHVLEIMLDMETDLGIKLQDLAVPPNPSLGEIAAAIERNLNATA